MGIEKSEIKMAVAHELGAGFDDALEAAERDIYRWDGAKTSLKNAATAVEGLIAHAKKDLDLEAIDEETYKLIRKWLQRSVEVVRNLRVQAEGHEQRAHGRAEALRTSVKITQRLYEEEAAKLKGVQGHDEEEPNGEVPRLGPARPTGIRPPNLIAAKKAADKAAAVASESDPEAEAEAGHTADAESAIAEPTGDIQEEASTEKKKKTRKCGECGEEGHTARTCKKKS